MLYRERLMNEGILKQKDVERIKEAAAREVEAAETFADESPIPDPAKFMTLLYAGQEVSNA
jgi:TPP-dependent pyruvate/acetoin dehydrogenase alpha subunit